MNRSAITGRSSQRNARHHLVVWLILLPFVLTGLFTFRDQPTLALWHLLATLSLGLLLGHLNRPFKDVAWVWVILIWFLVGCFGKSWLSLSLLDDETLISRRVSSLEHLTREDVLASYVWICVSFVVFCIVAVAISTRRPRPPRTFPAQRVLSRTLQVRRALALVLLVTIAGIIASALQTALGFGVMGMEQEHLPYRISTLIIRFRMDIAIGLLVLCVWNADRLESRPLMLLALGALTALATWDAIIRASRSSMLLYGLPIIMLWFISGRPTRRSTLVSCLVLVLTVVMFPVWTELRLVRSFEGADLIEGLTEVYQRQVQGTGRLDLREASATLLLRMGGADGLWRTRSVLNDQPWSTRWRALWRDGMSVYYTREVVGLRKPGFRAPSALGTFALVAGMPLTPLALGGFIGVIGLLWTWLGHLEVAPVGRALVASTLLFWFSDGLFGPREIFALAVTLASCGIVLRYWLHPRPESLTEMGVARVAGPMMSRRRLTLPARRLSPPVARTLAKSDTQ